MTLMSYQVNNKNSRKAKKKIKKQESHKKLTMTPNWENHQVKKNSNNNDNDNSAAKIIIEGNGLRSNSLTSR